MVVYIAEYTDGRYATEIIVQAASIEEARQLVMDQTAHLANITITRLAPRGI